MSKITGDEPATGFYERGFIETGLPPTTNPGLTIRQHYAGKVLCALISGRDSHLSYDAQPGYWQVLIQDAVKITDMLINELNSETRKQQGNITLIPRKGGNLEPTGIYDVSLDKTYDVKGFMAEILNGRGKSESGHFCLVNFNNECAPYRNGALLRQMPLQAETQTVKSVVAIFNDHENRMDYKITIINR